MCEVIVSKSLLGKICDFFYTTVDFAIWKNLRIFFFFLYIKKKISPSSIKGMKKLSENFCLIIGSGVEQLRDVRVQYAFLREMQFESFFFGSKH